MKIVLLANTRSGSGVARHAAGEFASAMRADGHEVEELAVGESHDRLAEALSRAGLLLLAGGDGTVHNALDEAMDAGVPVYHIPCGNENLLAREFGMDRSVAVLRGAIQRWQVVRVDVGMAHRHGARPQPFVLMCGVGPDAGVVERLTSLRTRAIGHRAYLEPVIREMLRPRLPALNIHVDGEWMVQGAPGMLIVANCRQYGFRVDPAHLASMTDRLLDVVFMPCATSLGALTWLARTRMRRQAVHAGLRYWRGREIVVQSKGAAPYQLDGDAPEILNGRAPADGLSLKLWVRPAALAVLAP